MHTYRSIPSCHLQPLRCDRESQTSLQPTVSLCVKRYARRVFAYRQLNYFLYFFLVILAQIVFFFFKYHVRTFSENVQKQFWLKGRVFRGRCHGDWSYSWPRGRSFSCLFHGAQLWCSHLPDSFLNTLQKKWHSGRENVILGILGIC